MKKTVIVLGSTGMIGHVIYTYLKMLGCYNVIGVSKSSSRFTDCKVNIETNLNGISKLVKSKKPDVVINCIGLLIKESELFPRRALFVNNYFPHYLEDLLKNTNTYLIQLSTNCVFEGIESSYKENSPKDGTSVYAHTKGMGEIFNRKDLTIRTTTIGPEVSKGGSGLLDWFLGQRGKITGYSNMLWNGLSTPLLAYYVNIFINEHPKGLVHLSSEKIISKYDLLNIMNDTFKKKLIIEKDSKFKQTKVLKPNCTYFVPSFFTYEHMIKKMYSWIELNSLLYKGKYNA